MITDIYQTSFSGSVNVPQNTSVPPYTASALVYVPAGATFSAQTSLSQQSVTLLATDDPIFVSTAYIIRTLTQLPSGGLQITWIGDVAGGGSVSHIPNGYAIQFGMSVSALSAAVTARAVGTVFLHA